MLLSISSLNQLAMARFQNSLCRAYVGFQGISSKGMVVCRFIRCLGLDFSVILWVCMVLASGGVEMIWVMVMV